MTILDFGFWILDLVSSRRANPFSDPPIQNPKSKIQNLYG
jgi:hypothetical protein